MRYVVVLCLFLVACGGKTPKAELNSLIYQAFKEDKTVSSAEWASFETFIKTHPDDLGELLVNGNIQKDALIKAIEAAAAKRKLEGVLVEVPANTNTKPVQVKVYVENSQSMDGYVSGKTEFETALADLLVDLGYHYGKNNIKLNFINTKIYEAPLPEGDFTDVVRDFVAKLEVQSPTYNVGQRNTSELNQIFSQILSQTKANEVSFLISDCIYSLPKGQDIPRGLAFNKSLTRSAFLEKSRQMPFSTLVLQLSSAFRGAYWDASSKRTNLNGTARPFYIWAMAAPETLGDLTAKIHPEEYTGYRNKLTFRGINTSAATTNATLLPATNTVGSYKIDRDDTNALTMEALEPAAGVLQFSVAINLGDAPVEASYAQNPTHYTASGGFKVVSVKPAQRQDFPDKGPAYRDWQRISEAKATHILTVRAEKGFPKENIEITLNDQIPAWVQTTHTEDDANISQAPEKTLGWAYLVGGVADAYRETTGGQPFVKIIVKIK